MFARARFPAFAILLTAASLAACDTAERGDEIDAADQREVGDEIDTADAIDAVDAASQPYVVDVAAVDYAFRMPREVPSGWTTFRMSNEGEEPHFLVLWKLPEGRTLQNYIDEVAVVFGTAYDSLKAGSVNPAGAGRILGERLPEWYGATRPMGGPGILAAGKVGETTVNLEPGSYVVECYIKTPDGRFHGELGMFAGLTVTDDSTGMAEPEADMEMTLTNTAIGTDGPVPAGEHTFAVHYREHPQGGLGNDVHVARLDDETSLEEVSAWMDWMNLEGLRAPAPVEFLGGAHEMEVGARSYFTLDLEPGRYAWVSEATTADRQVREFMVEGGD